MYELGRSLGADRISIGLVLGSDARRWIDRSPSPTTPRPPRRSARFSSEVLRPGPAKPGRSRWTCPSRPGTRWLDEIKRAAGLRAVRAALPDRALVPEGERPLLLRLVHRDDPRQRRPLPVLPPDEQGLQADGRRDEGALRRPLERARVHAAPPRDAGGAAGGDRAVYDRRRYRVIQPQCVKDGLCWLKNMYFRADEEFYRELGEALAKAARTERFAVLLPQGDPAGRGRGAAGSSAAPRWRARLVRASASEPCRAAPLLQDERVRRGELAGRTRATPPSRSRRTASGCCATSARTGRGCSRRSGRTRSSSRTRTRTTHWGLAEGTTVPVHASAITHEIAKDLPISAWRCQPGEPAGRARFRITACPVDPLGPLPLRRRAQSRSAAGRSFTRGTSSRSRIPTPRSRSRSLYIGDGSTLKATLVRRHQSGVPDQPHDRAGAAGLAGEIRDRAGDLLPLRLSEPDRDGGAGAEGQRSSGLAAEKAPGCRVTAARDGLSVEA